MHLKTNCKIQCSTTVSSVASVSVLPVDNVSLLSVMSVLRNVVSDRFRAKRGETRSARIDYLHKLV